MEAKTSTAIRQSTQFKTPLTVGCVSDVNYGKAQERVIQYQKNLDYARLAASRAK